MTLTSVYSDGFTITGDGSTSATALAEIAVATIAALQANVLMSTATTAVVADPLQGGVFCFVNGGVPFTSLTFNGSTITTSAGFSGFAAGQIITISNVLGATANNGIYVIDTIVTNTMTVLNASFTYTMESGRITIANGGTTFAATGSTLGCWKRLYNQSDGINVRWFGAKGDGIADDTAAIQLCWQFITILTFGNYTYTYTSSNDSFIRGLNTNVMYFPAGSYLYSGSGLSIPDKSYFKKTFSIIGDGENATRIINSSESYFINSISDGAGTIESCYCSSFQILGGMGFYHNRFAAQYPVPTNRKIFNRIIFANFDTCAVSSDSPNEPFYEVTYCRFSGGPASKSICLPPGGGHIVADNWFQAGKYFLHVRGGQDCKVLNNRFAGAGLIDIWIEPLSTSGNNNADGKGLEIQNNFHSDENNCVSDIFILIAAVDTTSGTDYASYGYSATAITDLSYDLIGISIRNNTYSTAGIFLNGLICSYLQRIGSLEFSGNKINVTCPYIIEFLPLTLTQFDVSNYFIQTNTFNFSVMELHSGTKTGIALSNLPGVGLVYDPFRFLRNSYPQIIEQTLPDEAYANLTGSMSDFTNDNGGATVSSSIMGMDGRYSARDVTFTAGGGRVKKPLDMTNANTNKLCWLQMDIGTGSTNSLSEINVRIGSAADSTKYFRYWTIEVPNSNDGWKTFTAPFLLPQLTALNLFIQPNDWSSAADFKIGRIRIYHSIAIQKDLRGKITCTPGTIAVGAVFSQLITVTGIVPGQFVTVSFDIDLAGIQLFAYVSANDTVTCIFRNSTSSGVVLATGNLSVRIE